MRHNNILAGMWSPRSIFIVVFICCIAVAMASSSDSEQETPIDSRFGSTSANLARKFQDIKRSIPHDKLPHTAEKIRDTGSWGMDYVISLVKVVGAGFAIAILSLIVGVLYGIIKLIRMWCCSSKKDTDDDEVRELSFYIYRHWIPTGFYVVAFAFLLTGMCFGIMNNPRFTDGVDDLGGYVENIGNDSITLGNGLISSIDAIIALIPLSVNEMLDQVSGVPDVADSVVQLGNDVNSTSAQVSTITAKVAAINAGNTTSVKNLYSQLSSINNSSQHVISQVSDLTYQIADKLLSSLNSTITNLNSSMTSIDTSVGTIEDTANGVISQADNLVHKVDKYVNDAKKYDKIRAKVVTAIFSVVIAVSVTFFVGYFLRVKVMLNVVAGLGFAFLFLLWLSGSIHFLLGMALVDSCPIMNTVVQGLIPNDTQAAVVLQGCLYDHRSVLDSLNITSFNLSDVFDYTQDFEQFEDFASSFNFSTIDDYFNSIQTLYSYNLTAVANNLTAESFGWNQSYVYDALDKLNQLTAPTYYGLNNYTSVDPSSYPSPQNQSVYDAKQTLTQLVATNTTVYNEIATAQQQLYSTQDDINDLLSNFTQFDDRYDTIKAEVNTLETQNITNCINIIDNIQNNITAFFQLGNCSFLGATYDSILVSLCGTMQPAIDLLTIAQFLAGIALIPMVIISEVLSFRVAEAPSMFQACGGDDTPHIEYPKKKGKFDSDDDYISVKVPPKKSGPSNVTKPALSATIASSGPLSSSTDRLASSNDSMKNSSDTLIDKKPNNARLSQNYVLPPLKNTPPPPLDYVPPPPPDYTPPPPKDYVPPPKL